MHKQDGKAKWPRNSGPEYHPTGSTICWRYQAISHQQASHIFSQFMDDQGSGSRITVSKDSSVPLDDGNGKQNAFLYGIMEHKRKVSIGILDLKLLWI